MRVTHSFTDDTATIHIEGLNASVRMLHLTDSHVQLYDERDGDRVEACADFCGRFAEQRKKDGVEVGPVEAFRRQLARAATQTLDLLALTGDTIHFPSPASVDFHSPAAGGCGSEENGSGTRALDAQSTRGSLGSTRTRLQNTSAPTSALVSDGVHT